IHKRIDGAHAGFCAFLLRTSFFSPYEGFCLDQRGNWNAYERLLFCLTATTRPLSGVRRRNQLSRRWTLVVSTGKCGKKAESNESSPGEVLHESRAYSLKKQMPLLSDTCEVFPSSAIWG